MITIIWRRPGLPIPPPDRLSVYSADLVSCIFIYLHSVTDISLAMHSRTVPTLLVTKIRGLFQDLQRPQNNFPGPWSKTLGCLESYVNSSSGVWGRAPDTKAFLAYLQSKNLPGGNNYYGYFLLQRHVYLNLKPKTAVRIIAYSTFKDLASRFPGLSRTDIIFQDFSGPGNVPIKIPGLSRCA